MSLTCTQSQLCTAFTCSDQLSYQVMSLTCTESQLCTAFRCSNQLSYQVMSLTCRLSQLCTATPFSSFIWCWYFISAFVSRGYFRNWGQHLEDKKQRFLNSKNFKVALLIWPPPILIASIQLLWENKCLKKISLQEQYQEIGLSYSLK